MPQKVVKGLTRSLLCLACQIAPSALFHQSVMVGFKDPVQAGNSRLLTCQLHNHLHVCFPKGMKLA